MPIGSCRISERRWSFCICTRKEATSTKVIDLINLVADSCPVNLVYDGDDHLFPMPEDVPESLYQEPIEWVNVLDGTLEIFI